MLISFSLLEENLFILLVLFLVLVLVVLLINENRLVLQQAFLNTGMTSLSQQ